MAGEQPSKAEAYTGVWPIFLGTLVGGVATVVLSFAAILEVAFHPWFPATTAAALMLLAVSPWILRVARSQDFFRGDVLAAASLLPIGLVVWMCAGWALHRHVVSIGSDDFVPTDGAWILVPLLLVFLGWLGGTIGKRMLPRFAHGGRGLRLCAYAFLGVAFIMTALATVRAHRLPQPDDYLASMPIVGHVLPRPQMPSSDVMAWGGASSTDETDVEDVRIRRNCGLPGERMHCWWRLDPAHGPFSEAATQPRYAWPRPTPSMAAAVRHDPRINLWVLDGGPDREGTRQWAFHHDHPWPRDLDVRDIAAVTSPPRGWIAGAWAGIVIAFVLLRVRTKAVVDPLAHWVEGMYMGDGRVLAADGSLITLLSPDAKLAVGSVVVQRPEAHTTGTYRDVRPRELRRVHSGTLADVTLAARLPPYTRAVVAMAAIVLTLAPLVAAMCVGLLG